MPACLRRQTDVIPAMHVTQPLCLLLIGLRISALPSYWCGVVFVLIAAFENLLCAMRTTVSCYVSNTLDCVSCC